LESNIFFVLGGRIIIAAFVIICCYYSFQLIPATSPFSNYNSGLFAITVTVLLFLFKPNRDERFLIAFWILFAAITIILLQSRTALLSFGMGYLLFFARKQYFFVMPYLFFIALLTGSFLTLSYYKLESTEGRWFIWNNCFSILSNNWLQGVGWGKFRYAYNEQQANWFLQNGFQHKETMLADTVYYSFNEWIQLAIEIGLPLTFFILAVIFFVVIRAFKNVMKSDDSCADQKIVAAFTALLFSSFFSYPFYYLPTLLLFGLLFIWVFKIAKFPFIDKRSVLTKRIGVISIFILAVLFLSMQFYTRIQWKNATELSSVGYRKLALMKMKKAYPMLQANGDYLFSLATIYASLNKEDSALIFLEKSAMSKNDYELHRKLGQLYLETGKQGLAEKHFLKAVYMVPNRFRSREMLVDFYVKTGNKEHAIYWAKETIQLKEKIPSETTKRIKGKMKGILGYSATN